MDGTTEERQVEKEAQNRKTKYAKTRKIRRETLHYMLVQANAKQIPIIDLNFSQWSKKLVGKERAYCEKRTEWTLKTTYYREQVNKMTGNM